MLRRSSFIPWVMALVWALLPAAYIQASEKEADMSATRSGGKILVVMTNHSRYPSRTDKTGLWLTELTHFYDVARAAGWQMDFVSPAGGEVPLDERSLKGLYMDDAARAHLADPAFMARLKNTLAPDAVNPANYRAIYFTGGHGTMWDFPDNKSLKTISEQIYRQGGIVSAVCHGVAGLLPLKDETGKPLIAGRKVTGFSAAEEFLSGIKSQVPFMLQDELVNRGASYEKALLPFTSYVVVDDRIITGQNPQSSEEIGEAVVNRLRTLK